MKKSRLIIAVGILIAASVVSATCVTFWNASPGVGATILILAIFSVWLSWMVGKEVGMGKPTYGIPFRKNTLLRVVALPLDSDYVVLQQYPYSRSELILVKHQLQSSTNPKLQVGHKYIWDGKYLESVI